MRTVTCCMVTVSVTLSSGIAAFLRCLANSTYNGAGEATRTGHRSDASFPGRERLCVRRAPLPKMVAPELKHRQERTGSGHPMPQ